MSKTDTTRHTATTTPGFLCNSGAPESPGAGQVVTDVSSLVAEGKEEGSVLGLREVGLQGRVRVEEVGGLEWEKGVSSEPG